MKDNFELDNKTGLFLPKDEINRLKENEETIEFEKTFSESWAELTIEESKKFEDYLKGLYKDLTYEYNQEIESKNKDEKIEFIQDLMDNITEALHNAEHKYSISELAEKQVGKLKSLRNTFENRLNDIYFESVSKESYIKKEKPVKKLNEVIVRKEWNDEEFKTFEKELKTHFKSFVTERYNRKTKGNKQPLNIIIVYLINKNFIDTDLENQEIFTFFKSLFFEENYKTDIEKDIANFDKFYRGYKASNNINTYLDTFKVFTSEIEVKMNEIKEKHNFINAK